jgi:hypothetical protein
MTDAELARDWFEKRGVEGYIDDGLLYIPVRGIDVQLSLAEVLYRSELRKEETDTSSNILYDHTDLQEIERLFPDTVFEWFDERVGVWEICDPAWDPEIEYRVRLRSRSVR